MAFHHCRTQIGSQFVVNLYLIQLLKAESLSLVLNQFNDKDKGKSKFTLQPDERAADIWVWRTTTLLKKAVLWLLDRLQGKKSWPGKITQEPQAASLLHPCCPIKMVLDITSNETQPTKQEIQFEFQTSGCFGHVHPWLFQVFGKWTWIWIIFISLPYLSNFLSMPISVTLLCK